MAGAEAGRSQELLLGVPCEEQGPSTSLFPDTFIEDWSEVEQLGLKQAPTWCQRGRQQLAQCAPNKFF